MSRGWISYFRSKWIFITIIVAAVAWNEYLSYKFNSLFWSDISVRDGDIRFLLVADPQLIGYHNEPTLSPISVLDSDRYLRNGFAASMDFANPNGIIFLGDLFDEGIESSEAEFERTVSRFYSIYSHGDYVNVNTIFFISGDNDVGGEYEHVQDHLVDRFRASFPKSINKVYDNFRVVEANLFSMDAKLHELYSSGINTFNILLSHAPVLPDLPVSKEVLMNSNPDLILSAHDHKAITHSLHRNQLSISRTVDLTDRWDIFSGDLGGALPVTEVQVPTCSYRMGTFSVGYGLLTLRPLPSTSGESTSRHRYQFFYSILWMPCRFYQFAIYIVALLLLLVVYVFPHIVNCTRRRGRYHILKFII